MYRRIMQLQNIKWNDAFNLQNDRIAEIQNDVGGSAVKEDISLISFTSEYELSADE